MSADHHEMRDFVVKHIPEVDEPISTATIAESLDMRVEEPKRIIDELEKGMTFLYRSRTEGVTWAYPVTVDSTPHRVTFDSADFTRVIQSALFAFPRSDLKIPKNKR